jgi:hypothetical protein
MELTPELTPDEVAPPRRVERAAVWMRRRARNVRARPLAVAALAAAAFVVALVALVVIPRGARRAARELAPGAARRPDTAAIDRAVAEAAARLRVGVERAELVGLAPRAAFAGRAPASVGLADFTPERELETYLTRAAGG